MKGNPKVTSEFGWIPEWNGGVTLGLPFRVLSIGVSEMVEIVVENEEKNYFWENLKVGMIFEPERFLKNCITLFLYCCNVAQFLGNSEKGNLKVVSGVTCKNMLQVVDKVIEIGGCGVGFWKGNPAAAHCAYTRITCFFKKEQIWTFKTLFLLSGYLLVLFNKIKHLGYNFRVTFGLPLILPRVTLPLNFRVLDFFSKKQQLTGKAR